MELDISFELEKDPFPMEENILEKISDTEIYTVEQNSRNREVQREEKTRKNNKKQKEQTNQDCFNTIFFNNKY